MNNMPMNNMNFPQNSFNTPAPQNNMNNFNNTNANNMSNNMPQPNMTNFNNNAMNNNPAGTQAFNNTNMGGQMNMGGNQQLADTDWSLDMVRSNLTMFENQTEDVRRNALGKLMFSKIVEVSPTIASDADLIGKVTSILIDFETFTCKEIVDNLSNNEEMIKNIEEACSIIKESSNNN